MRAEDFEQRLALGAEQKWTEFKGPGSLADADFRAKVMRAVMAMANSRDGGEVLLGVSESSTPGASVDPEGLADDDLRSWTQENLGDQLAKYAEPPPEVRVESFDHDGKNFVRIKVSQFADVPIICKKDYTPQGKNRPTLRAGACYVRPRRKPESVEVPTAVDMRDLIDLAVDTELRRFRQRAIEAGWSPPQAPPRTSDAEEFDEQLGDLR